MDTLIKVAGNGGFDFTPYLASYNTSPAVKPEMSTKTASTGFEAKKFGTSYKTIVTAVFRGDLSGAAIAAILTALHNAGEKAQFEYWCVQKRAMRKAYFFYTFPDTVDLICTEDNGYFDALSVVFEEADDASDVNESVVSAFGSLVNSSDGTWLNPNFIFVEDGSYVATPGGLNTDWDLIVYGFGFAIPSNAIINGVAIGTKYLCQMVAGQNPVGQLSLGIEYKGTKRGTALVTTDLPLVDNRLITWNTGIWTPDQLNSNDCKVYVRVRRKTTSTLVYYFDYISMSVIYTEVG